MEEHILHLKTVKGVVDARPIEGTQRNVLTNLENENNLGVLECLRRKYVLVVVHDTTFRDPLGPLAVVEEGKVFFPGLPFPEVGGKNVISASPSKDAHDFLRREFGWEDNLLATILIGFD